MPIGFATVAAGLGYAYTLAGRPGEGLPLLEQRGEPHVSTRASPLWMTPLSAAYLRAGRVDDAWTLAGQALARHRQSQEQGNEAYALHLLGDIAMRRAPSDVVSTEAHDRQALTLAEARGMRPLQAHCHRGFGTLSATMGQQEQAHAALSMAAEMSRGRERTCWLPEPEAALVQGKGRCS